MSRTARATDTTRQRGEATRQLLLEEATRQFAETGFNGTSLAAIAAACGLGNAGVLHHFPSKQRLYKAVLTRISEWLAEDVEAVLAGHATPEERLRAMIRRNVTGIVAHPGAERLILRELMDNAGRLGQARSLPLLPFVATFCELIEDAQRADAAPPGPAVVLLTQFLGTLSYALVVRPTFARMKLGTDLLENERRWIEAIGKTAERTLLLDRPDHSQPSRHHRRAS